MNPLDFTDPEFLKLYVFYGSSTLLAAGLLRLLWSRSPSAPLSKRWSPGVYPREGDAYAIALLRGGPREVVRALLGRLVADGFLRLERCTLHRPDESTREPSLAPLEEAALDALLPATGTHACLAARRAARALAPQIGALYRELEQEGLVPGESRRRAQRGIGFGTLLVVTGPGLVALLDRGRTQAGLLILVIAYLAICLFLLRPPRRTPAGQRYLEWLQDSHQGLVRMVSQGRWGEATELALAAGIYGLAALPTFTPLHRALREQPAAPGGGDTPEIDGEDTAGSSSCGGGCGGGGCGGCGGG